MVSAILRKRPLKRLGNLQARNEETSREGRQLQPTRLQSNYISERVSEVFKD